MKPDRSNYELWIIDWIDGKLDQSATDKLMAFLKENPDIKEETDSLSLSRLTSEKTEYTAKEILKKTISELPMSQIEFLSVAYLENDIIPEQESDLKQNIALNHDNKKTFETIQKIKLAPPQIIYKNKNLLKRQPAGVKVIRLASIGLSAAATIAVLILSYVFLTRYLSHKDDETEQIIATGSYPDIPFEVRMKVYSIPIEGPAGRDIKTRLSSVISNTSLTDEIINQPSLLAAADTSQRTIRPSEIEIQSVPVFLKPGISPGIHGPYLTTTNNTFKRVIYDEERSRINRFIARNFREKILKETFVNDSPLKSYEIAEAGIEGLNKLLGWEMALVKTNDETGELKSIYFSSRVLKFNAPVKKTESLP